MVVCWTDKGDLVITLVSFPKEKHKFSINFPYWVDAVHSGHTMSCPYEISDLISVRWVEKVHCKSDVRYFPQLHNLSSFLFHASVSTSMHSFFTATTIFQKFYEFIFTYLRHSSRQKSASFLRTEIGNKHNVIKDLSWSLSDIRIQVIEHSSIGRIIWVSQLILASPKQWELHTSRHLRSPGCVTKLKRQVLCRYLKYLS